MAAGANPRYYRMLALALTIGLVVAIFLGFADIKAFGLLEIETAVVVLFIIVFVIFAILGMFLIRVGDIFTIEDKLKQMLAGEGQKWSDSLREQERQAMELREQLKRDAKKTAEDLVKEQASQRMQVADATSAANRAGSDASRALASIEELRRRPETSAQLTALQGNVEALTREIANVRRMASSDSPAIRALQDDVSGLREALNKLSHQLGATVDRIEQRDLELAAHRQQLQSEVADLRKREQLLMLKKDELETRNAELATRTRGRTITIQHGEEKQHVLTIEGIGPAFASRLNAAGIITIPQLLRADPDTVANQVDVMPELVKEWQAMADLVRVKGIGPQSAEVLVKAGVKSVAHLTTLDPAEVSRMVKEAEAGRKVRIQGQNVTPDVARKWVEAARTGSFDS